MRYRAPCFVVIEGPSGVGKTTVTALLARRLIEQDFSVVTTREPSSSAIGQLARYGTDDYDSLVLACLVAADRYYHLTHEIRPALREGSLVLCDRYVPSSLVLQQIDDVDPAFLRLLNRYADVPDLTVFLVGEPERSEERARSRGTYSRFHDANSQVEAALYHAVAAELRSAGWPIIQYEVADQSVEQIANALRTLIVKRLTGLST